MSKLEQGYKQAIIYRLITGNDPEELAICIYEDAWRVIGEYGPNSEINAISQEQILQNVVSIIMHSTGEHLEDLSEIISRWASPALDDIADFFGVDDVEPTNSIWDEWQVNARPILKALNNSEKLWLK